MNCKHDIAMNNFEVNKMLHISETFSFFYEVQHASAEMGTMVPPYHCHGHICILTKSKGDNFKR